MSKAKKKGKSQAMTNIEMGEELGGGTMQENAQIKQLKKKKK